MSFGFSPSDLVALINITTKAYRGWRNACGEYSEITGSLDSLLIVVGRIEDEARKPNSVLLRTPNDGYDLRDILSNSESTVRELHAIVVRFKSLGSSREKNWDKLRLGVKNLDPLRTKLTQNIGAITAYLNTVGLGSLGRIERDLNAIPEQIQRTIDALAAEIRAGRREGSIMTTYSDDEKDVWKQFRRELISDGMKSTVIHRYKPLIRRYLQELAERGELEELPPEDVTRAEEMLLDSAPLIQSVPAELGQTTSQKTTDATLAMSGVEKPQPQAEIPSPLSSEDAVSDRELMDPSETDRERPSRSRRCEDSSEDNYTFLGIRETATSSKIEKEQTPCDELIKDEQPLVKKDRPKIIRGQNTSSWGFWDAQSKDKELLPVVEQSLCHLSDTVDEVYPSDNVADHPTVQDQDASDMSEDSAVSLEYPKTDPEAARISSKKNGFDPHSLVLADEKPANKHVSFDRKSQSSDTIQSSGYQPKAFYDTPRKRKVRRSRREPQSTASNLLPMLFAGAAAVSLVNRHNRAKRDDYYDE